LRRVDWFPNKKPGSPGVSGPTPCTGGGGGGARPTQDGGGADPVPPYWPTLLQVRCSIKKKPGSNRASRNPLTQHNSDILPDGSLDYPDHVLLRLGRAQLIRTKVMT